MQCNFDSCEATASRQGLCGRHQGIIMIPCMLHDGQGVDDVHVKTKLPYSVIAEIARKSGFASWADLAERRVRGVAA